MPHIGIGFFFSIFINLLQIAYLLYTRQLYDKVMISRSMETLLYLTVGVVVSYLVMGVLELIRSRLLVRVGVRFDQVVAEKVFTRMLEASVATGAATHTQGLKDLNSIRKFFGGTGIFACFDTPWVPIFLWLVYVFHPWLGALATAGALLLLLMVVAQEVFTAKIHKSHAGASQEADRFMDSAMRNVQSVHAMGMLPAMCRQWKRRNIYKVYYENQLNARAAFFQNMAKLIQSSTSVLVMSVGAYLVIVDETTIGAMIAASMMMGRALAPVLMLGNAWKSLVESRIAYQRLNELLDYQANPREPTPVDGAGGFEVENVSHGINGAPVLKDIGFVLNGGEFLAVVGPSGAGKSTLARILLGLWPPESGTVRFGDRDIRDLDPVELGRKIGYMPQEVELFSATVAENIARLGEADSEALVEAAMRANAHQMILDLPQGYDTPIGMGGISLSGGQKQRIALARALYGLPRLVVLDEPDSHLDQPGREALKSVLLQLKEEGVSLIVITHNQDLARVADRTLNLEGGRILRDDAAGAKTM